MATILVVDDVENNIIVLTMMLENMGHNHLSVQSGPDALELLKEKRVDLILLDLMMPAMDGIEVARRVKADPRTAAIPIILLTAKKSDSNEIAEALDGGVDEYLTKPIVQVELAGRVNSMLRMKALYDELERSKALMDEELVMAQSVQRSLLPTHFPYPDSLAFATRYHATSAVGGDFFDVIDYGKGRIGVVIADVSGHGPSAAMVVAMVKAILSDTTAPITPRAIIKNLNDSLIKIIPEERYLTLFFGLLDVTSGVMSYIRGGHPFPLLQRSDGSVERLTTGSDMVALFEDITLNEGEVTLHLGDRLLAYSDGIVEVFNESGEQFGMTRLAQLLEEGSSNDETLLDDILTASLAFQKGSFHEDDASMLLMRLLP